MNEHLDWPFFDAAHRTFADTLQTWMAARVTMENERKDVDERCRAWVRALGEAGWLKYCVEAVDGGMRP